MKTRKAALLFAVGLIAGISLTLCVAAGEKIAKPVETSSTDWSRLKTMTFPNGVTGLLDPATGRIYLYDINLVNCYAVRELRELGEPMIRIRN